MAFSTDGEDGGRESSGWGGCSVTHFVGAITVWCDGRLSKDTFVSPCDKNGKRGGRERQDERRWQENEVVEEGGGGRQAALTVVLID